MKAQTFSPLPLFFARALSLFYLFDSISFSRSPSCHSQTQASQGHQGVSMGARPISLEALTSSSLLARSLFFSLARSRAHARSLSLSSLPSFLPPRLCVCLSPTGYLMIDVIRGDGVLC